MNRSPLSRYRPGRRRLLTLAGGAALLTVTRAGAQSSVASAAVADTVIDANVNVDGNLGGTPELEVYRTDEADVRRILLAFRVATPVGGPMRARLRLHAFDADFDDGPQTIAVHLLTGEWTEGTGTDFAEDGRSLGATWLQAAPDSPWATPGGDYDPEPLDRVTIPANASGPYTWDVTAAVRGWLSGAPNYGLLLRAEDGPWHNHKFHGREAADRDLRPRLVVERE